MEISISNEDLLSIISTNRSSDFAWQERKHPDWTENYTLYRDKVTLNRLTQRQSINVPLMKGIIKNILKDIDDLPDLYFDNNDNDKDKEILYNEHWEHVKKKNKLILKDIVDKKQVLLYGRSFKKLNIINGQVVITIEDPHDILLDRYMDPTDIDSVKHLEHINIFRTLTSLTTNGRYDQTEVRRLKEWFASDEGLQKNDANYESLQAKNDRMREMGAIDVDNPVLGETYVELNENYMWVYNPEIDEEELYCVTTAENGYVLARERLEDIVDPDQRCKDHFWRYHLPYTSWADDVENTDTWSDAVADIIRPGNQVANSWVSQMVENRTLKNFGMNYYDATDAEGFEPQTYEPVPWGWYPVPGNPNEKVMRVDIDDLSDSIEGLNFMIGVVEKATSVGSTQQGAPTEKRITLGEVELTLKEAKESIQTMGIFYTEDWLDLGTKFNKLVEANPDRLDGIKVNRKGYNGTMFSKEIEPSDYQSKNGYGVTVITKKQKQEKDLNTIQTLNAIKSQMPNNMALNEIYQSRLLDLAELNPDEKRRVLDFEKQEQERLKTQALADANIANATSTGGDSAQGIPSVVPTNPQMNNPAPGGTMPMQA